MLLTTHCSPSQLTDWAGSLRLTLPVASDMGTGRLGSCCQVSMKKAWSMTLSSGACAWGVRYCSWAGAGDRVELGGEP